MVLIGFWFWGWVGVLPSTYSGCSVVVYFRQGMHLLLCHRLHRSLLCISISLCKSLSVPPLLQVFFICFEADNESRLPWRLLPGSIRSLWSTQCSRIGRKCHSSRASHSTVWRVCEDYKSCYHVSSVYPVTLYLYFSLPKPPASKLCDWSLFLTLMLLHYCLDQEIWRFHDLALVQEWVLALRLKYPKGIWKSSNVLRWII